MLSVYNSEAAAPSHQPAVPVAQGAPGAAVPGKLPTAAAHGKPLSLSLCPHRTAAQYSCGSRGVCAHPLAHSSAQGGEILVCAACFSPALAHPGTQGSGLVNFRSYSETNGKFQEKPAEAK